MTLKSILPMAMIATLGLTGAVALQAQDRPTASPHAAANPATKSPDAMTQAPLARGRTSFTRAQARARLEKAGYSHVSDLAKDRDGLWQARAMRHGRWVKAAVDYKGNVAAH
jgi:hypothetical protein